VGQVRTNLDRVKLAMWSVATFNELQKNEEVNPNWRQVGSLRLAETPERVEEFKLMEKVCQKAGLDMGFITGLSISLIWLVICVLFFLASDAKKKWPGMQFENAKAILYCPSDGYLQPYDLAMTYRYHARKKGVRFFTDSTLRSIQLSPGKQVHAVITDKGKIECDLIINAAGAHAYHVAKVIINV
jgi:glycine/D-amino acid oxidase-like deaminating enzyme